MEPSSSSSSLKRKEPSDESYEIAERMKNYEKSYGDLCVDPAFPFIIRLDGHKFSSYTKLLQKPFDTRLARAMELTSIDLLTQFNPSTVFTCSDEISMIFPAYTPEDVPSSSSTSTTTADNNNNNNNNSNNNNNEDEDKEMKDVQKGKPQIPFRGRVLKLSTLTASYASVCFNKHMMSQITENAPPTTEKEKQLHEFLQRTIAHFDSRIFSLPNNEEVLHNIRWRSHFDCKRNSISSLAQHHFKQKEIQGLGAKLMIQKLQTKGINWNAMPSHYKFGSYIKKERYTMHAVDKKTGQPVQALRSRPMVKSFEIEDRPENIDFLLCKYYESKQEQEGGTDSKKSEPNVDE